MMTGQSICVKMFFFSPFIKQTVHKARVISIQTTLASEAEQAKIYLRLAELAIMTKVANKLLKFLLKISITATFHPTS